MLLIKSQKYLQNMTMSQWPRPLATNCNLFILGSKWTFVLNLMKLLEMKALQRYRGDKNVIRQLPPQLWPAQRRKTPLCVPLYVHLLKIWWWRNSVPLFCIIRTYLVDSQSFNPGCVCLREPSLFCQIPAQMAKCQWMPHLHDCSLFLTEPAHRQQQSTTC